ncbi:ribonuclease HII [Acidianus sp. HS-5]|nr:ribonuclease HII [Acidianus sp. HS-5]
MIIAGVIVDEKIEGILKEIGVKDSKMLSREKREKLFDFISDFAEAYIVNKAYPEEIDSNNLNDLTYMKIIQIIYASLPFQPRVVTIDKVGNEEIVIEKIRELGLKDNVVYEADVNFIEASAASIIAKVIRDRIIDSLKKIYGDFGSGYPSDPKTRQWITEMYEKDKNNPPPIIRRTWKTLLKIAPNYHISKGELYGY